MVEHTILLRKLEYYGIRGLALKWMTSYLKNRSQFVSLSGENSSIKHMQYGVPQGSILGPLLFIIDIVQQLNALCNILPNWVTSNGLALNLKKTKYMLFSRQNIELPDEI